MGLPSWCSHFQGRAILSASSLGGGHGQGVYKVHAHNVPLPVVAKCFNHQQHQDMAVAEAESLKAITMAVDGLAPQVLEVIHTPQGSCVFMEYLEAVTGSKSAENDFVPKLAAMHSTTSNSFGFHCDTFIGGIRQENTPQQNWADFYLARRLEPMFTACFNRGFFNSASSKQFHQLCKTFQSAVPGVKPSLLHGDLWSGNRINTASGSVLIDACCCYGHHEMDLAMMQLFGGFSESTFQQYHHIVPAGPGKDERLQIYSLYYLLVHVRLFGVAYVSSCRNILTQYS